MKCVQKNREKPGDNYAKSENLSLAKSVNVKQEQKSNLYNIQGFKSIFD